MRKIPSAQPIRRGVGIGVAAAEVTERAWTETELTQRITEQDIVFRSGPKKLRRASAACLQADGARQRRTAVRIPRRISSGGGGQPGTATSTGMTLATRPQVA